VRDWQRTIWFWRWSGSRCGRNFKGIFTTAEHGQMKNFGDNSGIYLRILAKLFEWWDISLAKTIRFWHWPDHDPDAGILAVFYQYGLWLSRNFAPTCTNEVTNSVTWVVPTYCTFMR